MKVEFRTMAEVIDLVLCPTCGAYAIEGHKAGCTNMPTLGDWCDICNGPQMVMPDGTHECACMVLPAPETSTKEPVTALALNNMLDPV